jgi:hypothetical protein
VFELGVIAISVSLAAMSVLAFENHLLTFVDFVNACVAIMA